MPLIAGLLSNIRAGTNRTKMHCFFNFFKFEITPGKINEMIALQPIIRVRSSSNTNFKNNYENVKYSGASRVVTQLPTIANGIAEIVDLTADREKTTKKQAFYHPF